MGTPLYMAPEQANFNAVDVDTRADVYALRRVILYELLTGTTPITRGGSHDESAAIDEMPQANPRAGRPDAVEPIEHRPSAPSVAASRRMEPQKLRSVREGDSIGSS